MSFNDNIFSREQGTSAELYIFSFSNGTSLYFTSFERDLLTTETWDGNAYTHIPIQRSEYENDDSLASNRLTINAPALNSFASTLISGGQIDVSITKVFLSDKTYQSIFNGLILSIEKNVGEAIATCASKMYYLEKELPRVFFQDACNNTLFDSKCTLSKSAFTVSCTGVISNNSMGLPVIFTMNTLITTVNSITIPQGNVSGKKGFWQLGQCVFGGEVRYITFHLNTVLSLHYPFSRNPSGAMTVQLIPGCDKSGAYCVSPFSNIANFTGFPYMPASDPTMIAVGS